MDSNVMDMKGWSTKGKDASFERCTVVILFLGDPIVQLDLILALNANKCIDFRTEILILTGT